MGEAARWLESLILQMAVLCGAQWHWAGSLTCCLPPLPSSPPLPSPPPPSPPPAESLLRRWIPAPWPLAADLERKGGDSPLSPPKKMSMFGLLLMTPICHCRITPDRPRDFQLTWGPSRHWSEVGCSMVYRNISIKLLSAAFTSGTHHPHQPFTVSAER